MRFADLFAGLGGFRPAAAALGAECVFACEVSPGLQRVYEANCGIKPVDEIRKIPVADILPHDLLCAGFPCH